MQTDGWTDRQKDRMYGRTDLKLDEPTKGKEWSKMTKDLIFR